MLTKYIDDKAIIAIGTFLILSVFAYQLTGIDNYRDILEENPNYDLILLTNDTVDRLELLGRSYTDSEEFYRWSFKDGKVKTYIASDLIDTSYWQLFQGTKQIYYNEKSPLDYVYDANSAKIIIGIDYFLDSRHTNYVGRLDREIEVYPNKNKETIKWYPKNKTIKYNFQWVHETDHLGESKNLKEEYKTDLDKLQINWNDSIEQVSAARQYLNGKVKVRYISAYGDQIIDPIVKIGGTTVTYDRYDGLGGVNYTPECFIGEVCHLPLSITLSKNFVVTDKMQLSKRFKNKHGIDIVLPTSGVNIWGDINKTIQNWINETCTDYSEYLYDGGNETWYWNNWTECIGGYFEEINETVQAWKPLELPLSIEKNVPIYIDIYGIKNSTDAIDALGLILGYTTYEFAWWNSSWDYKKEIQIDGIGDDIPANYQLKLEVDYDSDMNSTFKDLRFTNSDENVSLDYWVEQNISETNATVWVEVPTISTTTNTTIYMYYGNPTATSESNGHAVFPIFDDFNDGTINTTTWYHINNAGTSTESSGVLHLTGGSLAWNIWVSKYNLSNINMIMESRMKMDELVSSSYGQFGLKDYIDQNRFYVSSYPSAKYWRATKANSNNDVSRTYSFNSDYQILKIIRINTTSEKMYVEDVLKHERTVDTYIATVDMAVTMGGYNTAYDIYTDWVRVRKYTATEPTYSFGAEEGANTAPIVTLSSPADDSTNASKTVNFSFTPIDETGFTSCALWTNETSWSEKESNTSSITNNSINTIAETFTSDGTYLWNIKCIDSGDLSAFASSNWTIHINSTLKIEFISPTETNDTTIYVDNTYINTTITAGVEDNLTAFIDWNYSLVGWWRFDNSTDFLDHSTHSNDGTNNGSIYTASGKFGGGREFDGIDNYIDYGNDSSLNFGNGVFTIEFWTKTDIAQVPTIMAKGNTNSYSVEAGSDGSVLFIISDGIISPDVQSSTLINDSIWHHVICIRNETDISIYIDGILENVADSTTVGSIDSSLNLTVGGAPVWDAYFNGSIDEVRLWKRALSEEEINASYNAGTYRLKNNFTSLDAEIYEYTAYVQNPLGDINQTETRTLTIDLFPTYSDNSTNSTIAGSSVLQSLKWEDESGLSGHIFSFDNGTGSFTNDSWIPMTGTLNWSNVTKTVNSTVGTTIRWQVYANDTSDNWVESSIYSYNTTTADPCAPPEFGNWTLDLSLNCNISDETIHLGATGWFKLIKNGSASFINTILSAVGIEWENDIEARLNMSGTNVTFNWTG